MKTITKASLALALASLAISQLAVANPLPETSIPQDVDWFAHLDADKLRSSEVGGYFFDQLANLEALNKNEKLPINPVLILNGLKGITTFGTIPNPQAAQQGDVDVVVLVNGTPELMQIFQGLLSGFQLEKPEAIQEILEGDHKILHMVEQGVSGVFVGENQIAISKSLDSMTRFLAVQSGKTSHLRFGEKFPVPQYIAGLGIYLGVYVEGIGDYKQLPAQARILQLTRAVAVQLGESSDNMHMLASLVTDAPETAAQVRDVLNGLVAVMVLTQNGNPEVASIVQSVKVSQDDKAVSLKVDYPAISARKWIDVLIDRISAEMAGKQQPAEVSGGDSEAVEIEPIRDEQPNG